MTIKTTGKKKVVSSRGGFKSWMIEYIDTKTRKTWWDDGGDISKNKNKNKLKVKSA